MSVVYIALPVALLLAVAGVVAFIWATRSGQMDDLDTPGQRVLFDDEDPPGTDVRRHGRERDNVS
ncbi:MAG: cbb3-type cytochrome oxidase assembly protein CcoS [Holophagae bacterium]